MINATSKIAFETGHKQDKIWPRFDEPAELKLTFSLIPPASIELEMKRNEKNQMNFRDDWTHVQKKMRNLLGERCIKKVKETERQMDKGTKSEQRAYVSISNKSSAWLDHISKPWHVEQCRLTWIRVGFN